MVVARGEVKEKDFCFMEDCKKGANSPVVDLYADVPYSLMHDQCSARLMHGVLKIQKEV